MNLLEWRTRTSTTQDVFASAIQTSRANLSKIERGLTSPSTELAKRIEAATNGEVTAASLLGLNDTAKRKARGVREDGASFDHADKPWRKAVTVTLEVELTAGQLEDYRKHLPELEAIAAEGARAALRDAHQKAWNEANREAVDAHTKWIEERGTFHDQCGER